MPQRMSILGRKICNLKIHHMSQISRPLNASSCLGRDRCWPATSQCIDTSCTWGKHYPCASCWWNKHPLISVSAPPEEEMVMAWSLVHWVLSPITQWSCVACMYWWYLSVRYESVRWTLSSLSKAIEGSVGKQQNSCVCPTHLNCQQREADVKTN